MCRTRPFLLTKRRAPRSRELGQRLRVGAEVAALRVDRPQAVGDGLPGVLGLPVVDAERDDELADVDVLVADGVVQQLRGGQRMGVVRRGDEPFGAVASRWSIRRALVLR